MYTKVLPSISPTQIKQPYRFEMTGIIIYSIEELYYHCYHYWKESIDDFIMGRLEAWIRDALGLPFIANQIARIQEESQISITKQYMEFLSLIDYFQDKELYALSKKIFRWEHKHEWERAKDKGDLYMHRGEYTQAIVQYQKALEYTEDGKLLNNISMAYMQMGQYQKASQYLTAAYKKEPQNPKILINCALLAQQQKDYEQAENYLQSALTIEETGIGWFYYGSLKEQMGRKEEAYEGYQRSILFKDSQEGFLALARWHRKNGEPEKALEKLEQMPFTHHWDFYIEKANILETENKGAEAIIVLQKASQSLLPNPQGLTTLSRLYRTNNQVPQAKKIIEQAIQLYPENVEVQLEWSRVQKKEGKTKSYQQKLKKILFGWIQRYRQQSEELL
ncbi:MAG: tetratricopeptide repeat protein [Epulopiscium sp.]|nr:tetratricopeptide repeat protein [Candidatus Epulonipiscium sp.]